MAIYLLIVFFLFLLLIFQKKANLVIPFILLFCISAFRAQTVGIDYEGYKDAYLTEISSSTPISSLLYKFEIGWILLNEFVQNYLGGFEFLIVIVSFITIFPFFYLFRKETKSPIFAVLLYVLLFTYTLPFSLIKQGISISFYVLAVYYFDNNKKIKSILCAIVFSVIHYSSLLLIPITIIAKYIKISNRNIIIFLSATFVVGILGITDSIRDLIELLPFAKYAHYADYKSDVEFNRINVYLFLLPKNIMCCLIFFYLPEKYDLYKKLLFIGLIIANLFISISLVSRFVLYLYPFEIFLLANLAYAYKGRLRGQLQFVILFYSLIYFIYNIYTNRGGIIPYDTFFN